MSLFTLGWILWLLWFVVEEGIALVMPDHGVGTLSDHVWHWFDIHNKKAVARHAVLLVFLVWLTVHLSFGWFG